MGNRWKKDYFKEILKYDKRVEKYIANEHAKVLKEHIDNMTDN